MDPGSPAPSLSPAGALGDLANRAGLNFVNLDRARAYAAERIANARADLQNLAPHDLSVVMFGSWARGELTEGSDNDWAILTPAGREADQDVRALAGACEQRFNADGRAPGSQDVFGVPFAWPTLHENVGLDKDSNRNLTRRMLTLLESVAITGDARDLSWNAILERYLRWDVKAHHPPRFLLNDTIRYWRTICVDFEGKHKDRGGEDPKWVMRNAKLRTSRKMLYAAGLLPALFCRLRDSDEIASHLRAQFAAPATDRLAWAFQEMGLVDEGARCLAAYDEWVGLLQHQEFRNAMALLRADTRDSSPQFRQVREIEARINRSLLALLFDSDIGPEARRFLVL